MASISNKQKTTGTITTVDGQMAFVNVDGITAGRFPPMIESSRVFNGIPLTQIFTVGQKISGTYDPETNRFVPDLAFSSPENFRDEYPVGTVVLAYVLETDHRSAVVYPHPLLRVEMKKLDFTSNPNDRISSLYSAGDIIRARVCESAKGQLRLDASEVDDTDESAIAPVLFEGADPWLSTQQVDLIEKFKRDAAEQQREREELKHAIEILASQSSKDMNQIVKMLESQFESTSQTGGTRNVGSLQASGLTGRELLNAQQQAADIRRAILNYQVRAEELFELNQKLQTMIAERESSISEITAQLVEVRGQLSDARKASQQQQKLAHSGGKSQATIDERRTRFETEEEWLREEVRSFWIENYGPADRKRFNLNEKNWAISKVFIETLLSFDEGQKEKAVRAITHLVTGRSQAEPGLLEDHPLREGDESAKPEVTRKDGANARRVYLESHTPQARRLHYWKKPDGSIELSRVGLHDDFTP